ncbi:MAG: Gfo/Idh/MocA family protein [Sphaerochaetaceae bacterium]
MRVAVLGVAHVHANQLLEISKSKDCFQIVGIWDHDENRAKAFSEKYRVPYVPDMEELLDKDLAGVFVFSENIFHKPLCLQALKKVKNILCEKPLATTVSDAQEIVDACTASSVNLRLAYNNRFTNAAVQAKELINSGIIGRITGLSGTNHGNNPGGWFVDVKLSGGGSMIDHTVHLADLAYWITGYKPVSVYAANSTVFNDIQCEDCGSMIIELEGSIPFTIDFSWSRPKGFPVNGDNKLQIDGTKGTCLIDNRGEVLEQMEKGVYSISSYSKNAYDEMLDDFARSIKGDFAWGATGAEGIESVKVVEAAYQSCRSGEKVAII